MHFSRKALKIRLCATFFQKKYTNYCVIVICYKSNSYMLITFITAWKSKRYT